MGRILKMKLFKTIISSILFLFISNTVLLSNNTIAIIKSQDLSTYNEIIEGFNTSSAVRLKDYKIEIYNGEGNIENIEKIVNNLKNNVKPDLIITIGIQATFVTQQLVDNIPIIFCGVYNWDNFFSKKDNMSGIELSISPDLQILYLKMALQDLKKIAFIYNPDFSQEIINSFKDLEKRLSNSEDNRIEVIEKPIRLSRRSQNISLRNLRRIVESLPDDINLLYLPPDPTIITQENFNFLVEYTKTNKIPLVCFNEELVKHGAFASLSPNYENIGSQVASKSERILIRKVPLSDLKILDPIGSEFVINFTTAEILNLEVDLLRMVVNKGFY